ncbi:fimbrillin family protein [Bacteroides reticulotermitis]|uniref:Uncharacterized protein n=2 Tax=Bacteroides reticulotermitis TaxID=1133319 RepID=W4UT72_9BACE|nr:fimbrillin family protein [Bacteroides reticulotermitis]MBB4043648.1 hypothetical protein [Bacteroides reticulotermitis]GAE83719.1 hypothetical protein JCM10512_2013 [Bacteroides reticulotermitis JCM 10512]
MKNNLFYATIIAVVALALGGCSDDATDTQPVPAPAVLMAKIYTLDPEEEGTHWKSGKNVGVYVLKGNTTECVSPYNNVKYQTTVTPEGYFTPAVKEDVIYYPQDGSKVDIIAYYPWKETVADELYPMDVSSQKIAANFSFLYAGNGKGLSSSNQKTTLELRPVLSQIVFDLKPGDGVVEEYLRESEIKISGMNTKADFNLLSGQFEESSEPKDIALVTFAEKDEATNIERNGASAQVLPASSTEGYIVEIKLPNMNRTYYWELTKGTTLLEQSVRYICTARIDLEKIEVVTEVKPIEDWQDGANKEVAAEENRIQQDIESLPVGTLSTITKPFDMLMHTWGFYKRIEDGKTLTAEVEYDETLGRNVIHAKYVSANSWYKYFFAYRTGNVKPTTYALKFKAKGTNSKDIRCYIEGNKDRYITSNALVTGDKYIGYIQFRLTGEYKEYELVFNFARAIVGTASTAFPEGDPKLVETTEDNLKDFYIAFHSQSGGDVEIYMDDISFQEYK